MGMNKDLVFAIIVFVMSVILISQSAIVVQTYRKDGKTKDSNYWWSVFVLVVSIIGLFAAGFMGWKSQRPSNGNVRMNNGKINVNAPSNMAGGAAPQPMMAVEPNGIPAAQPVKQN